MSNSSHIRITGTGAAGVNYGIKISGSTNTGINLLHKSDNFEVDHLEITGIGGTGIGVSSKADSTCPDGSPTSWRGYDYNNDGEIDAQDAVNRNNYTQHYFS